MMKYLLDTCVITDFVKNHSETVRKIKMLKPSELCISVITASEIEYGIQRINGTKQGEYVYKTTKLITSVMVELEVNHGIAVEAGRIRNELNIVGQPIGAYDILIAATAKYHNLIMVTSNIAEFKRVDNLVLENWRQQ